MEEFKILTEKRRAKQLLMALVFAAILVFGWFLPLLGYFIPLCMLLGIGMSLRRGRKWCNWYCPRGSFYDVLISTISPKKDIPEILKKIYFRVIVIFVLMAIMTVNLILRWPDVNRMGMVFVVMLNVTTILGMILAIIFHQRSWCTVCPIGTMANIIGRNKPVLKINSEACIECKLCSKVCPVQIKPYLYKKQGAQLMRDKDCLKCGLCVSACPTKALNF